MSRPWLHQDDVDWRRTLILEIMYEGTLHYATSPLCHNAAVPLCGNATMRRCHYATTPLWNYATMPASIQLRSGHCPGQARLPLWRRWSRLRTLGRWSFSSFVSFVASGSDRWRLKRRRSSVARRQTLSRSFFFIVESRKRKSNCESVRVIVSETEREYLRDECVRVCVWVCVREKEKLFLTSGGKKMIGTNKHVLPFRVRKRRKSFFY